MSAYQDQRDKLAAEMSEFDAWLTETVSAVLDQVQRGDRDYEVHELSCEVRVSIMGWRARHIGGSMWRYGVDPRCSQVWLWFPDAKITFNTDPESWPPLPPRLSRTWRYSVLEWLRGVL